MDSNIDKILDLLDTKPKGWFKQYQKLMAKEFNIPRLIEGPEHKGYNPETRRGLAVAYLDPKKYDFYWLEGIEPLRYLRKEELND